MDVQQIQDEIISCLWSEGLKAKITELGYKFTESELLGIVYHFAPNFDERLRFFRLLADRAPSVADHALKCIAWQKKCLQLFKTKGDNELFELRIKVEPNSFEASFLCDTYDLALEMIDEFYNEYDFYRETELSRAVIKKRKVLRQGDAFFDDDLGESILLADKVLYSVDALPRETEYGLCTYSCEHCLNSCVSNLEICFPLFLKQCSLVRYRLFDGDIKFGINLNIDKSLMISDCYILPLESDLIKNRAYEKYWDYHDHEHIASPNVDCVATDQLDTDSLENYYAFVEWFKSESRFRLMRE